MRILFLTSIRYFTLLSLSLLFFACNGENIDPVTEVSCSSAKGLWTIVGVTCDGVSVEIDPVTYLFDDVTGNITQTTGRVDCATQFNWLVEVGAETAIFSMTGSGNLSCSKSGADVNFCSSEINSCNAGINITGLRNEYPTCVIERDGMSLIRNVSLVNNPDNLSFCENGQTETVTLRQGDYIPPPPPPPGNDPEDTRAFIEVVGNNPTDFGVHPVGSRIVRALTLTNTGFGPATGLTAHGLDAPFLFVGVKYPGIGGSCTETLEKGDSCTILIEFFPQVASYYTDNLTINYSNGSSAIAISQGLAATASANLAQLTISRGPFYNFGKIVTGQPEVQTFTVRNSGGADAIGVFPSALTPPFSYTGGVYPGLAGDCGSLLTTTQDCILEVEFTPQAVGPFNDTIEMNYFDGANDQKTRRNIFGEGVAP